LQLKVFQEILGDLNISRPDLDLDDTQIKLAMAIAENKQD
jgi:hypothetical protein